MSTSMSTENISSVFLCLSSGDTYEVPLKDLDITLGEFLDVALKGLEVSGFPSDRHYCTF